MTLFLNIAGLLVAYAYGSVMLGGAVLPLVYGLPRAMVWVARGRCRPVVLLYGLIAPLLSLGASTLAILSVERLMSPQLFSLFASPGWRAGLFLAVAELWYGVLFSRTTQAAIDERYLAVMARFLRAPRAASKHGIRQTPDHVRRPAMNTR